MDERDSPKGSLPRASASKSAKSGKNAIPGVLISDRSFSSVRHGETMYEHALKNTQSRRLQKVLGKR